RERAGGLAPLRKAADAIEVDTSGLTVEQVVERLLATIERRGGTGQVTVGPPVNRLYAVLKVPAVAIARTMFRLESRGCENIPAAGPVLLVSNHSSVLDPPLIGSAVARQLHFLAKAELFDVPLFGGLIRRVHARP